MHQLLSILLAAAIALPYAASCEVASAAPMSCCGDHCCCGTDTCACGESDQQSPTQRDDAIPSQRINDFRPATQPRLPELVAVESLSLSVPPVAPAAVSSSRDLLRRKSVMLT